MSRGEGTERPCRGGLGVLRRDTRPSMLTMSLGPQEVIQDFQASVLQVSDSPYDEQ